MDNLFVIFNNKISQLSQSVKVAILLASFGVFLLSLVGSLYLIETIEMLGVLLGVISGVSLLLAFLIASNIFLEKIFTNDIRHMFALSTRRKMAVGVLAIALLSAAIAGDSTNPLIGIGLIFCVGILGIFASTTEMEKEAMQNIEDEIIWRYENEESED